MPYAAPGAAAWKGSSTGAPAAETTHSVSKPITASMPWAAAHWTMRRANCRWQAGCGTPCWS